MAVLGSLKFLIEADSTPVQRSAVAAAKALEKLENAVDRFGAGLKQQTRAVDQAERAHDKLAKTVAAGAVTQEKSAAGWAKEIAIFQRYRAALYLVGAGLQGVFKIAEEGARAAAAEAYFRNAGKSIGEFRAATGGLISDAQLMKKANLADTMGLTGETFKTLANVAHASAAKTGQSFQHMLDSIILGTARESRLLLDNLGIIVNVTDAKKKFAASLKGGAEAAKYESLTVDQLANSLTDAGEKAAFFAAVHEKGLGPLAEQAEIGGTAADNFDRFAAAVDNLKIAIGKLLAEGSESALASMAKHIGDIANYLDRIGKFGMIKKGGIIDTISGAIGSAASAVGGMVPEGTGKMLGIGAAAVTAPMVAPLAVTGALLNDLFEGPAANQELATKRFADLARQIHEAGLAVDKIPEFAKAFAEYPNEMARAWPKLNGAVLDEANKLGAALEVWRKAATGTGGKPALVDPEEAARKQKEANEKWKKALEKREQDERDHIKRVLAHEKAWFDKEMELRKAAAERMQALFARMLHKETPAERMARAGAMGMGIGDYEGRAQAAADAEARRDIARQKEREAAAGVDQAHSVISAAMSGSASALGAGIGGFFGPLGTAIGSLIGELLDPLTPVIELMGHLASGIKGLLELGLNPFLETLRPLGPALELLLRAVGVLIGSALRPFIPYMHLIVAALTAVIDIVALVVVALSPFVEIIIQVTLAFGLLISLLWNLASLFSGGALLSFFDAMSLAAWGVQLFTESVADGAVWINNALVRFVRSIGRMLGKADVFDLRHFGDTISREDLMPPPDPTLEENTDATSDNTRAVEQLSRDLRNLPSGYKVNYALYNATAPVRQYPVVSDSVGAAARSRFGGNPPNYRWRT